MTGTNCDLFTHKQSRSYLNHLVHGGTRWRSWLRHCATSRNVEGSIPDGVTEIFSDSASNRNEYQEYFLGVKAAGA
jgi:hypothetical protein